MRLGRALAVLALAAWHAAWADVPETPAPDAAPAPAQLVYPPDDPGEYFSFLSKQEYAYLHYPEAERAKSREGAALVQLSLDPQGSPIAAKILISSGDEAFDSEAQQVWSRMASGGVRLLTADWASQNPNKPGYFFIIPVNFCLKYPCAAVTDLCKRMDQQSEAAALGAMESGKGNAAEAISQETASIAAFPEARSYYRRGRDYLQLGNYQAAIADETASIENSMGYCEAYRLRGSAYYRDKQYSLAQDDLSRAIKYCPDMLDAYLERASMNSDLQHWEAALADADQVVKMDAGPHTLAFRARLYHRMGKPAEGLADADRAIELDGSLADYYELRGDLLEDLGQKDQAVAAYRKALALDPIATLAHDGLLRLGAGP